MALTAGCGFIDGAAAATCNPNIPEVHTVGDTAGDLSCTEDTIQAAIDNVACAGAKIFITTERNYTAQHVSIQDKTLSLIGTSASCSAAGSARPDIAPTAPIVTLDGAGNGGISVLAVRGTSNVTVQFLELTHGSSSGHGGGIDFQGAGALTLDTTTLDLNSASFGGGIGFNATGSSATLTLKAYSVIASNTANIDGGGIEIEGTSDLVAVEPSIRIGDNHAVNGKGGGIAVVSPAHADIGSSDDNDIGVLDGNSAALGGAISGEVTNDNEVVLDFFSTDPLHPVTLSNNFASQGGGAVYVLPHGNGLAVACMSDFHIVGNTAPDGSAILIDADVATTGTPASADLEFNTNFLFCPNGFAREPCAPGVACNVIESNVNADATHTPQPGATIVHRATFIGEFAGSRFAMRNNTGAHAIRAFDAITRLDNCLIADNSYSGELVRSDNGGDAVQPTTLAIDACTFVNNAGGSGSAIYTDYDLTLTGSIVDQPSMSVVTTSASPTIAAHDILAANPAGLIAQTDIVTGEPTFIDPQHGSYRQRAVVQKNVVTASSGIDFAPAGNAGDRDLDGDLRDQDIPSIPDRFGVRDVGCYEAQPITDRIFADAISDPVLIVQ